MKKTLQMAVHQEIIRPIDLHAAIFLSRLSPEKSCKPDQLIIAALVSHAIGMGHVCLPLKSIAGKTIFKTIKPYKIPDIDILRKILIQWSAVGEPGGKTPLILDSDNRLYFLRYYNYQHTISQDLLTRNKAIEDVDHPHAKQLINRLFPDTSILDGQRLAATLSLFKRLVIISGGPGTGKTHTVARILALLNNVNSQPLRIGLAAPTGKAANRLQESIIQAKSRLDEKLQASIPENPQTLHRLLGFQPDSGSFRANKNNPLHLDLLVLDEASMIDIPMMAQVLEALPQKARLIILGDRDQLASVEAGSLFADLCGDTTHFKCSQQLYSILSQYNKHLQHERSSTVPFSDSVLRLQQSYRFKKDSCIGKLAAAVNNSDSKRMVKILDSSQPDFNFIALSQINILPWFSKALFHYYLDISKQNNPADALHCFDRFRILCALRDGPCGINSMNIMVKKILTDKGIISAGDTWYKGQPIMIRCNHYGLQLFNGDTGIIWPTKDGTLLAWFSRTDGDLLSVAPSRLPEHEAAYAVTIHKSQGSEFDEVLLVLPPEEHQIVTKELIYTGITRAKNKLTLLGESIALQYSIEKKVIRHSGLARSLWNL